MKEKAKIPSLIVLADDDPDDRDLFTEAALTVMPSIEIMTFKDGVILMEELTVKKLRPDFIFLDLNMPRKGGKECLVEISASEILRKIPVVIYSTSVHPNDVEETFNRGAIYFFQKPNSFENIKKMLDKVLNFPGLHPVNQEEFLISSPIG